MKKITLMAALLGSAYFANAQVGIGTPTPSASAMLDISSTNKGVLIPRVALSSTIDVTTITGDEIESLLVYNINTSKEDVTIETIVTPGFYYWNVNKWERIVSQTDLTNAIENANAELEDIIDLLQTAYPSNNLDGSTTSGPALGGGMVYTPAVGTEGAVGYVPAKIEYVYYNGTTYVKQDVTSEIVDLINANETKTKFVTINNKQYYVSESYAGTGDPVLGTEAGVYLIDVVGGVVNNIEEIFTTSTTIVINEGETNQQTFTTVQEYIEYIISESDLQEGVMTFVPGTGATTAEQLASSSFAYTLADGTQSAAVTFSSIVKANQSLTDIITSNVANVINYVYTAEPALDGTARTYTIELTTDLISQINNNQNVRNAITNVSNGGIFYNGTGAALMVGDVSIPAGSLYTKDTNGNGVLIDLGSIVVSEVVENFNTIVNSPVTVNGNAYNTVEEYIQYISETSDANVGYTTTLIPVSENTVENVVGSEIPAGSFYYINADGIKVFIPIPSGVTAETIILALNNATTTQVETIKTQLGDNFNTSNVVKTGDTWVDGGAIYKGIYTTSVLGGTSNITGGTTIDPGSIIITTPDGTNLGDVISIKILNSSTNTLITVSVTDVSVEYGILKFRIGTGNMYNVLSPNDLDVKVLVEFSVTETQP